MKKLIVLVSLFATVCAQAQNPSAINRELPAPKLKPLQPADLVIANTTLVNAVWSPDLKEWVIKVNLTIKNTGQINTTGTDLKPMVQKTGTSQWKHTGTNGILIGLKPGESVTKEYVFVDKQRILGRTDSFRFKVVMDPFNKVKEANENNNESALLNITSPN